MAERFTIRPQALEELRKKAHALAQELGHELSWQHAEIEPETFRRGSCTHCDAPATIRVVRGGPPEIEGDAVSVQCPAER